IPSDQPGGRCIVGLQIDITLANWIAPLIEPEASIPIFPVQGLEREGLRTFLQNLRAGYLSSPKAEEQFRAKVDGWLAHWDNLSEDQLKEVVFWLRRYFRGRPWTALILPSGKSWDIDYHLSSLQFLRTVVDRAPDFPGLILQMDADGAALSK